MNPVRRLKNAVDAPDLTKEGAIEWFTNVLALVVVLALLVCWVVLCFWIAAQYPWEFLPMLSAVFVGLIVVAWRGTR